MPAAPYDPGSELLPYSGDGQAIKSVELYRDLPWAAGAIPIANFTATDGSFSSSVENVTVTLTDANMPSSFNQIYYAQASDAAGNRGPVSAIFLSPLGDFKNEFE